MSCAIIGDYQISAIVWWWATNMPPNAKSFKNDAERAIFCQELGDLFKKANYEAHAHRYDNRYPEDRAHAYRFVQPKDPPNEWVIYKACRSLAYQLLDDPKHDITQAWQMIEAIQEAIIDSVPQYRNAPWFLEAIENG